MRRAALLFPLMACLLASCSDYTEKGQPHAVVQSVKGLTLLETSSGTVTWKLTAATADLYDNGTRIKMSSPTVSMQDHGKETAYLQARKGELLVDDKSVVLTGAVKAISRTEQATLDTELLNYSRDKGKIWTDEDVLVVQNGVTVTGKGLEAKPDLSEMEIKNQHTQVPKEIKKKDKK